jgi:hypothetical protein
MIESTFKQYYAEKLLLKKLFFVGTLKVNYEYRRIRIQIRIRILTKMSWIRNTVTKNDIFPIIV